jgi:PAS domain S-box-containing protein
MERRHHSSQNQLIPVYHHLINYQPELNEQLSILFKELALDNRYTLHPRRIDELAHEEAKSFLTFLSLGDTQKVFKHGGQRVNIGLGTRTILALISHLRKFCWDRLNKKDLQLLDVAFCGVDQYIASYFEGYMTEFETQILSDQEQMRRALSAALQRQSQELIAKDHAIETAINGIMFTDLEGHVTYTNPAFMKMWGYDHFNEVQEADISQFFGTENFDELLRVQRESAGGQRELSGICKDGSTFDAVVSASFIQDEKFAPIGIMAFFIDVTERNQLEAQLQRAQKMEALGTLAGGVAHDLNNILSGLVSYPELLLLDLPEDSHSREHILSMQRSGKKAAAIAQDLLTLARRGVIVTDVLNLNDIILSYFSSPEFEKLIDLYPDFQLQTQLDPDLLNILGSFVHLSKTVMNLVYNAAESMPDGGEVLIVTKNRYLDKPIRGYDHVKEGDYVILTVSDGGVGISSKDIKRIFEPFYTKKTMGRRSGTGLGMAVVWGTIKDHNGYIDVKSREGKGTTFTLYFPVTRKDLAKEKTPVSIEDYMAGGESILVVDDVENQRNIATNLLNRLGYSVTAVSSGEKAVEYMKNYKADLLVLDMIMDPGIDGLETYKRILKLHPDQKAIIVSGFSETKRVKAAQKLGAGAYVRKPYLLEKIGLAIRVELDR